MAIYQIYPIVNKLAQQSLGKTAVVNTEATFISAGGQILSSETNREAFYNALCELIGATVSSIRAYEAQTDDVKRNPIEYGVALRKISMPLLNADVNQTWLGQSASDRRSPYEVFPSQPIMRIFNKVATWEFPQTVPDVQLTFAFQNSESMAAFIDMLFMAAYNSVEVAYENCGNLCRAHSIAMRIGTPRAINLLERYYADTGKGLTVNNALNDKDFLRYISMMIKLYSDRMTKMSTTFNDGSIARHTPKDYQRITVHADIDARMAMILQSDTYHDTLVKLDGYTVLPYWQGSGTNWAWADTSKINIDINSDESVVNAPNSTKTLSNIVATISDIENLGTTINNRRSTSQYNPRDEYTNFFHKADMGYYTDPSENSIVFYLDDSNIAITGSPVLVSVTNLTK